MEKTFLLLLMNVEWIFIFGFLLIVNIVSIVIVSTNNKGDIYFIEVSFNGNSNPFLIKSTLFIPAFDSALIFPS